MKRIVTFGCSLMYHPAIREALENNFQCEVLNYSHSASGNDQQISNFHSYILNEHDDDDFVLWEITSIGRRFGFFDLHDEQLTNIYNYYGEYLAPHLRNSTGNEKYVRMKKHNYFTQHDQLQYLSNNQKLEKVVLNCENIKDITPLGNNGQTLQSITSEIILLSKLTKKHAIYPGWNGIFRLQNWDNHKQWNENFKDKFDNVMREKNINYLNEPYVEWCMKNKLPMKEDNFHPADYAAEQWINKIIVPYIKKLDK